MDKMTTVQEIRYYVNVAGFDGKTVTRGDLIMMGYNPNDVMEALPIGFFATDPKQD